MVKTEPLEEMRNKKTGLTFTQRQLIQCRARRESDGIFDSGNVELAGVTTRALRWYDKIGLLKPSRTAESGYRYYGPAEVDRLQDILYYRALGVELARIRESLDDPSFNRLSALRDHLSTLMAERARIES